MRKFVDLLISVFYIGFLFIVIYMILLKLTGHSPTIDQIIVSLSVGTAVMVIKIFYDTGKFSAYMEHNKDDIREIKTDVNDIRKEMSSKFEKINKELILIKTKLS